jgi:hypothetical protein
MFDKMPQIMFIGIITISDVLCLAGPGITPAQRLAAFVTQGNDTYLAWGAGTTDHRIGPAGAKILGDMGFRWRNDLNFQINLGGANIVIPPTQWWFSPITANVVPAGPAPAPVAGAAMVAAGGAGLRIVTPGGGGGPAFGVAASGYATVHRHLSNLAWDIRTMLSAAAAAAGAVVVDPRIENVATAAITIIVQDPNVPADGGAPPAGHVKAFTSVLYDIAAPGNALIAASINLRAVPLAGPGAVALPGGAAAALSYAYPAEAIAAGIINGPLAMFIANTDATACTEKQMIARLFGLGVPGVAGGLGLFRHIIDNLLGIANGLGGVAAITYAHIKAVILHIHTTKDPCAKCARLLSGVSRQMNMQPNIAPVVQKQTPAMTAFLFAEFPMMAGAFGVPHNLITNLSNGNARFLIEVSSNSHYGVSECLHAECSGDDGNAVQGKVINCGNGIIDFNAPGANLLVIPNGAGGGGNWTFPLAVAAGQSFPPYVIFSRVGVTGVGPALPLHGSDCPLIPIGGNGNTHMHQPLPILPGI